ncbi:MAG: cytochrome C [Chloroflexota bacterium]|nr:MAG: cytochrome C [Chloroflexota bacterium]
MKSFFASLLGPNIHVELADGTRRPLNDYLIPNAIFSIAGLILIASTFLPYWRMDMTAPQYPKGLYVNVFVNRLEGDMKEVDALNHYLGMPPLDMGGQLERSLSLFAILSIGLILTASVFVHNRLAVLLALPMLAYPLIFLADLWYILYTYGHSIDPQSALGGAIKPFTPPLVGEGGIGQFGTYSSLEVGFWLAVMAAIVTLIGLYFHRRAYKPVLEAKKRTEQNAAVQA